MHEPLLLDILDAIEYEHQILCSREPGPTPQKADLTGGFADDGLCRMFLSTEEKHISSSFAKVSRSWPRRCLSAISKRGPRTHILWAQPRSRTKSKECIDGAESRRYARCMGCGPGVAYYHSEEYRIGAGLTCIRLEESRVKQTGCTTANIDDKYWVEQNGVRDVISLGADAHRCELAGEVSQPQDFGE